MRKSFDEWERQARAAHGAKYGYDELKKAWNTLTANSKGPIVCNEHGIFYQILSGHISGKRCKKCAYNATSKKLTYTTEMFIAKVKEIFGDLYGYELVKYIDVGTKVIITCNTHGIFEQYPYHHLAGKGCKRCAIDKWRLTTEKFIEKAIIVHGHKYEYSLVEYEHGRIKVDILCNNHGVFKQTPMTHLEGKGCPACLYKGETKVGEMLDILNIQYQKLTLNIDGYVCFPDFYLPDYDMIIEYNGGQHYAPTSFAKNISMDDAQTLFIKQQARDERLRQYCAKNNIHLLEIDGRKIKKDKRIEAFMIDYFGKLRCKVIS
jgi:hypothetical protein